MMPDWREALLRLAYRGYERRLLAQLRDGPMPHHLGIILDGNRRHGRRRGLTDPREVYALGAQKLDHVLAWADEIGVRAITLWVCSTDNLGRSADQVSGLLSVIERKLHELARDEAVRRRGVKVAAIGRLDLLPPSTVAAIQEAMRATADHTRMTLTVAVGYGGREEICDAVRAVLAHEERRGMSLRETIDKVTPEAIGRHLYMAQAPDPDLIIRTSGEIRLSGFLLWQSAYSEFYFADVFWPAFRKIDLLRAVRAYQLRQRRFGR